MAIDYGRYGDPSEASNLQTKGLKELFDMIGNQEKNRLEQMRTRGDANQMAQRLFNTARLQGNGMGSGMSRAMERGTEIGAKASKDLQIHQNEQDLMNRFKAMSAAGQVAGQQQQMGLSELGFLEDLKRYQDSQAQRYENRQWSLEDFHKQTAAQKELAQFQQMLGKQNETPWYQRLLGGVARGVGAYFTGGLSEAGIAAAKAVKGAASK